MWMGAGACASRPPRLFSPAGPFEAARALEAWSGAVARASSVSPTRLIYDARISRGVMRGSGTLSVIVTPDDLQASLAGPFGSPIARYENGALRGEGLRTIIIEPDQLRALLAGVWTEGTPEVAGIDGSYALLKWRGPTSVDGVLSISGAHFESLRLSRSEGTIAASYAGFSDAWPQRIELEDVRSGDKMRLTLVSFQ